jgi:hypothetical protein
MKVLFVTHSIESCGVYQYGLNITKAIQSHSKEVEWDYFECNSELNLANKVKESAPDLIVLNFHPGTLPWVVNNYGFLKIICTHLGIPLCGFFHEVTQQKIDNGEQSAFDFVLCPDPTLSVPNLKYWKLPRLILEPDEELKVKDNKGKLVISSFGFPFRNKGFLELLHAVNSQFDNAVLKLNLPENTAVGEELRAESRAVLQELQAYKRKPNIDLIISQDFLSTQEVLKFLADSNLNCFLYHSLPDRGVSSCIDYALGVKVPIAISKSNMFRHLGSKYKDLCVENSSLVDILNRGIFPLSDFYNKWSSVEFAKNMEQTLNNILNVWKRK